MIQDASFWQISRLLSTYGFQMGSECSIRMGIALSFDLAPELLDILTSLTPA
jgi:hypothetical protein